MKAKDFIVEKLRKLSKSFPEIRIRYEFRISTQSHIIEIIPLTIFDEDVVYLQEETDFENEFEKLFPTENIVFISEGSLTEIKDAELELGLNIINFDSCPSVFEFEIEDFKEEVMTGGENNFALAA